VVRLVWREVSGPFHHIGIPLRQSNVPNQSVDRISDLQAIVVDNREYGFQLAAARGSFGGFLLRFQVALRHFAGSGSRRPTTSSSNRAPTQIKGIELSADMAV